MRPLLALVAVSGLVLLAGCSSAPTSTGLGTVRLRMTDAPGPYDAVNLVVEQVATHRADSDTSGGWEVLSSTPATYDLMQLRNGVFATLGQALVPAGHYTQVRLKLGAGSNVVAGGVTYPLDVPSGSESGYKLVGEFDVPAGGTVDLALDFDAARSIVLTGSGKYLLKPTVRVLPFSNAGAIAGHLLPEGVEAQVYALAGPDTVASAMPGADGRFQITPLAAGLYTVGIHPTGAYRDTSIAGVTVAAQQTADLGDIQLTPQ
jgi:hypothetical protein